MIKRQIASPRALQDTNLTRRRLLAGAGAGAGVLLLRPPSIWAAPAPSFTPAPAEGVTFADGPRQMVQYPGKRALIRVTTRPPHLETPFEVFNEGVLTPNDAFFVRYHLAGLPPDVDLATYRIAVTGAVKNPLQLSLADLKGLADPVNVVAVNQCSGNSRGFSDPRVFGAQLGNGAMGNARWTGVPLHKVLARANPGAKARQVVINGLDHPVLPSTPDFRKALDIEHAMADGPLLAWSMNGEDIPFLNGYPVKLIVPGYFGTYWVKHVSEITVIEDEFSGHDAFFMTTAYRVPDNDCTCVPPGSTPSATRPISLLPVRSFITSLVSGATLHAATPVELKGIAFDGGSGIKAVDVSTDAGTSWQAAQLGEDLGPYSFREWRLPARFSAKGVTTLKVRATNNRGETQPATASWNPGGYRRDVIESYSVHIV